MLRAVRVLFVTLLTVAAPAAAQTLSLLDVPYLTQSEALCGGAAAAMVLRFWGAREVSAESFAGLLEPTGVGIRTDVLRADLIGRGWNAVAIQDDAQAVVRELDAGRPAIALIEDRPGTYHYVVVVGWHARGVVLHDPARVPFRVMAVDEFQRRWRVTRRWTLAVTPGTAPLSAGIPVGADAVAPVIPENGVTCDALVARGVSEAQALSVEAAERTLTGALGCPGGAVIRELAGVRALQRRWPEVIELASTVVAQDPADVYAWQLLATARFVTDDQAGALAAWNVTGQPRVDLIRVEGLRRTRQRVVERLARAETGHLLTLDHLSRIERQLADWPAARTTAVSYVPKPAGLADLRIVVAERDRVPHRPIELGIIGVRAVVTREIRVAFGAITSEGDRLELGWRFWPERPRYAAGLLAPAPWGGLWGVQVSSERQPLTAPALETVRHDSGGVVLRGWQTGRWRWQAGAGLDRWVELGRFGTLQATVDFVTLGEGLKAQARGQRWLGSDGFGALDLSVRGTRALQAGRYVLEGRGALSRVSAQAPYDLWPAGDTGHVRSTLLRAHPLLADGRYLTSRLGAGVVTASVEVQRIWRSHGLRLGPAIFADVGRTSRRLDGTAIRDADIGMGLRARLPGMPGLIRLDAAHGLRDGSRAVSFVYEP